MGLPLQTNKISKASPGVFLWEVSYTVAWNVMFDPTGRADDCPVANHSFKAFVTKSMEARKDPRNMIFFVIFFATDVT